MLCHGKGQASILGPVNKVPQDEKNQENPHGHCLFPCDSCHSPFDRNL